jgi:IclR family transcriptional regulator, acetate operon repressor
VAADDGGAGPRSVAGRIFAVLDAFDGVGGALRLTTIAERTGLPLPTALRMVRELVAWGGLERQTDGSYRIGKRLWVLGTAAPCVRHLGEVAAPHLRDLAGVTEQGVELAVRDELWARIVERVEGRPGSVAPAAVGERVPLHATGVGRAILAAADPAVLQDVVGQGPRRHTPHTTTLPGRLAAELERVRASGVAVVHQELRLGVTTVAAPVLVGTGPALGAIGVVARSDREPARYEAAVRRAAAAISQAVAPAGGPLPTAPVQPGASGRA